MSEEAEVKTCFNPGCDQPGTKSCSACKTNAYCSVSCQTADWPSHKEECDGHLRKVGKANLDKAAGYQQAQNWVQALRHGEIAATKLQQLKDRRLETVELIDKALLIKFDALQFLCRHREAMECIKECYTLWAMNHMRNPGSMKAALALIQSCIHNKLYEDAENYARHAYFMIAEMTDNFIPSEQQPWFLAEVSHYLAAAIHRLAESGGIPPEGKQKAGEEAIELARKALKMRTQLYGIENAEVAMAMSTLADILDYFNDVDDDDTLCLREKAIAIYRQFHGHSSLNVANVAINMGVAYTKRAIRALDANNIDLYKENLALALPNYLEAARIFRAINQMDEADKALRFVADIEKKIREVEIAKVAAAKG